MGVDNNVTASDQRTRRTLELCLEEVDRCVAATHRPNFLLLLGDWLGWRPLPGGIKDATFDRLRSALTGTEGVGLLERWYPRSDANALPPVRPIRAPADADDAEERQLPRRSRRSSRRSTSTRPRPPCWPGSGTEQVVRRRLKVAPAPDGATVVVVRRIDPEPPDRFGIWHDVVRGGTADTDAADRLAALRRDVGVALGPAGLRHSTRLVGDAVERGIWTPPLGGARPAGHGRRRRADRPGRAVAGG